MCTLLVVHVCIVAIIIIIISVCVCVYYDDYENDVRLLIYQLNGL